jgi:hypothetical protein
MTVVKGVVSVFGRISANKRPTLFFLIIENGFKKNLHSTAAAEARNMTREGRERPYEACADLCQTSDTLHSNMQLRL